MTIDKITVKLLGQKLSLYRALDKDGEVIKVFETMEEAKAFIA